MNQHLSRRGAMKAGSTVYLGGAIAALDALLTGCAAGVSSGGGSSTANSNSSRTGNNTNGSSCVQVTNVSRESYFVDNIADPNIASDVVDSAIPQRSDIRSDTKGLTGVQNGLPLTLTIRLGAYSSAACTSIYGAQVLIWQCNAQGIYSDVSVSTNGANTTGFNYLRGYQYTDYNGQATFTTIYPGWHRGRAVHIHLKIRIFDLLGGVTTEATTQLFFDDSVTDAVYVNNASYARTSSRDTPNSADSVYKAGDPALLVALSGTSTTAYSGTVSIGINVGTIYGG